MDVDPILVSYGQAVVLVPPAQGRLDHPAVPAQATAVGLAAYSDAGFDATPSELDAVGQGVKGAMGVEALGRRRGLPRLSPMGEIAFTRRISGVLPVGWPRLAFGVQQEATLQRSWTLLSSRG
jgi:hypothetical protein